MLSYIIFFIVFITTSAIFLYQIKHYINKFNNAMSLLTELKESKMTEVNSLEVELATLKQKSNQFQEMILILQKEKKDLVLRCEENINKYNEQKEQFDIVKTTYRNEKKHFEEQLQQLKDIKLQTKLEFQNIANSILEQNSKSFESTSSKSLKHIVDPIQEEILKFKNRLDAIHTEESKQRVELKTQLELLQQLNQNITQQTHDLTIALKGEKKTQGNWGELVLENVLENAGLSLGTDYEREVSFNTESGKKRPDVVVFLPQNKHIVIDAKTSLNAYTDFVNQDDQALRNLAIKKHILAIKDRIKELSMKQYWELPNIKTPEVVIMFIPVESAYVEAIKHDPNIFQEALNKNILVTTPTTLLTSLNIVKQLWQFEQQSKNSAELAKRAQLFHKKLSSFLGNIELVGASINKTRETYDKVISQLYTGQGNLIKQANEFKDLGVAVQTELPKSLVEKSKIEIDKYQGIDT